jgi:hypothetical protein
MTVRNSTMAVVFQHAVCDGHTLFEVYAIKSARISDVKAIFGLRILIFSGMLRVRGARV